MLAQTIRWYSINQVLQFGRVKFGLAASLLQDYGDVISASCVCWTSVFHAREGEYRKGKWEWSAAGIPDEKKSAARLWGEATVLTLRKDRLKKRFETVWAMVHGHQSIPAPSRASLSMSSATATRRAAPHPPRPGERRGRGKNERENPSSRGRGGGECLAGPVAVPAHGGCEAKPPEADEEGGGVRREKSRLLALGAHTNATLLCSPSNLLQAVTPVERASFG